MNWHRFLLVTGVGLSGLGLLALVVPGLFDARVGQTAVALVAVLALLQALRFATARRHTDFVRERTPDPEQLQTATPPGNDLQEAIQQFRMKPHAFYRMSGRPGLQAAAVAVLTRYEDLSTAEAHDRVERGTWTDDREAARFLSDRGSDLPIPQAFRVWLSDESAYQRGVRRCADAIATIASVPLEPTDETDDGRWWPLGRRRSGTRSESHGARDGQFAEPDGGAGRGGRRPGTGTGDRPDTGLLARRETRRWLGISVVALVPLGVGILLEEPGVLLVGVVGLFYAVYARSHELASAALSVERSLDDDRPSAGEEVEVTVGVTNEGAQTLPDVRVVDSVPDGLAVTDGLPRRGTVLRPGETAEWTYTITARRGVHEFDPALVLVRNAPGTVELAYGIAPDQPTRLTCTQTFRALPVPVPLRGANAHYAGRQPTTASGDGTEFYATRLYRHGDELSRIDWNRRAKTGELSTLLFREERTATVVLLVDTDGSAYVAPDGDSDNAVDRSVAAAGRAFGTLSEQGHLVGLASLTDTDCWLEPGTGPTHRARARTLLTTHPALQSTPSESQDIPMRVRETLSRRLSPGTQLVVFSPLCRRSVVRFVRRLEAAGYPVTVVSPDATAGRTPSQRLARVGRRVRVTDLRRDGIPVVDWDWDEPLTAALSRFQSQGVNG